MLSSRTWGRNERAQEGATDNNWVNIYSSTVKIYTEPFEKFFAFRSFPSSQVVQSSIQRTHFGCKKTRWRAFRWDSASDTTASIRITINSYQLSKSQQVPSARCEARYSWWYFSFETKESILEHIQLSRKLNFHLACIFFLFHLHGFGYKTSPSSKTYNVY